MAKIVYKNVFTAADQPVGPSTYELYEPPMSVEKCRRFPGDGKDIAEIPDRRAYRAMNRSAIILAGAALPANEFIKEHTKDPFRVGFYCATDNGPDNFQCAKGSPAYESEEFAGYYRKNRSPKDYLKQLPNLVPAQIAIFLEILGLLNVYNNTHWGGLQALDQADADLHAGVVDLAVVAGTISLEDALYARRRRREMDASKVLTEGAAIVVMEKGDSRQNWNAEYEKLPASENFYGIADPVIRVAENSN